MAVLEWQPIVHRENNLYCKGNNPNTKVARFESWYRSLLLDNVLSLINGYVTVHLRLFHLGWVPVEREIINVYDVFEI